MRKIPLFGVHGNGKYALVDDEDYEKCIKHRWNVNRLDYPIRGMKTDKGWRSITMHRFILDFPKGFIDHKNRNPLDNRRSNLRSCTPKQNRANTKPNLGKRYKGVFSNPPGWIARITTDGKTFNLGTYKTKEEAAAVYNKKAIEIHKEYAFINKL